MVALLEPTKQSAEETTQGKGPSSATEREILDLLRRPARYPPGIRDLRHELLPFHSLLEIQNAMFSLLDKGLIVVVHTSGFGLGFRLAKTNW